MVNKTFFFALQKLYETRVGKTIQVVQIANGQEDNCKIEVVDRIRHRSDALPIDVIEVLRSEVVYLGPEWTMCPAVCVLYKVKCLNFTKHERWKGEMGVHQGPR